MTADQNVIVLNNVDLLSLREKISAFKILFECVNPIIEVKGTFQDKKGNIIFLNRGFRALDVYSVRRRWLSVICDGEFTVVTPVDDVIAEVRFSY